MKTPGERVGPGGVVGCYDEQGARKHFEGRADQPTTAKNDQRALWDGEDQQGGVSTCLRHARNEAPVTRYNYWILRDNRALVRYEHLKFILHSHHVPVASEGCWGARVLEVDLNPITTDRSVNRPDF